MIAEEKIIKKSERIVSLDILRVLAIFCVVGIHTSQMFVYGKDTSSWGFVLGNILNCFSRIGVPLFVMISGALMLNESKALTFKKVLSKVLKIFVLLLVWSTVYAVFLRIIRPIRQGKAPVFSEFVKAALTGDYYLTGAFHFWYLYMIMGLYLITPILRKFVCVANAKIVLWFIILAFVTIFLPSFLDSIFKIFNVNDNVLTNYISQFRLSFVGEYVSYYLLGWYLFNVTFSNIVKNVIYVVGVVSLAFIIIGTQFTYGEKGVFLFYDNLKFPAISYAAAVFLFFKNLKETQGNKFLFLLSKLSFGVYAVHILFQELAVRLFASISISPLRMVVYFVFICISSFITSYILSIIPFIKKLIRF